MTESLKTFFNFQLGTSGRISEGSAGISERTSKGIQKRIPNGILEAVPEIILEGETLLKESRRKFLEES